MIMKIVLHSDDLVLSEHWQKAISEKYVLVDDLEELANVNSSIVIINVSACSPKCRELVQELKKRSNRVLILQRVPNLQTAKEFLRNGADGYGNAMMREHFLNSAIYTIEEGLVWLHPELTSQMIQDIPLSKEFNEDALNELTAREKEVAILLKDGDSYKFVAEKLDITPRTVKAHAQHIYAKLNVKDRLGLALLLK